MAIIITKEKIPDLWHIKLFQEDKINVTQKWKFSFRKKQHIIEKRENADDQHFLLLPTIFQPNQKYVSDFQSGF